MKRPMIVALCVALYPAHQAKADPEGLSERTAQLALQGWRLYQQEKFAGGEFNGGRYTDPVPKKRGYEFWSNGHFARLDRTGGGFHNVIFRITSGKLVYVGTLGGKETFVTTARDSAHLQGKTLKEAGFLK